MKQYELLYSKRNAKIIAMLDKIFSAFERNREVKNRISATNDKIKILVLANTRIGDAVMIVPLMNSLRTNFPNAEIIVVCDKLSYVIFDREQLVDVFFELDWKEMFSTIRSSLFSIHKVKNIINQCGEVDLCIETAGDFRIEYFMKFVHAKNKIGTAIAGGECFLTDVVEIDKDEHPVMRANKMAQYISGKNEHILPSLKNFINEGTEHVLYCSTYKIGINVGASKDVKKWNYFAELIDRLDLPNISIILYGIKDDLNEIETIKQKCVNKRIPCQIVIEKFEKYIELLNMSNLLISNDSSAGHLAAAQGIPTISLFGPTDSKMWKPCGVGRITVLKGDVECAPCNNMYCEKGKLCMESISVEAVYNAICKEYDIYLKEDNL